MDALDPEVAALVEELNAFGEDTEPQLIASMYRHLAYWPAYLALVRTMLVPLQRGRAAKRIDAFDARARTRPPWHRPRIAAKSSRATPDSLPGIPRFVPAVRRTPDRPYDGALRLDPAGDTASEVSEIRALQLGFVPKRLDCREGYRQSFTCAHQPKQHLEAIFPDVERCSKSCCRMMVMSSGYFALRPSESFTPSAWVRKVILTGRCSEALRECLGDLRP